MVNLALAERTAKGLKVRQPLSKLKIQNQKSKIQNDKELLDLIKDEVNVKEILFDDKIEKEIELDTNITERAERRRNDARYCEVCAGYKKRAGAKAKR